MDLIKSTLSVETVRQKHKLINKSYSIYAYKYDY